MSLSNAKIAVLGATGYIGRSLVFTLTERGAAVVPVSRDVERASQVFGKYGITPKTPAIDYGTFLRTDLDVVINATGIGSPKKIASKPTAVFKVTEDMDELIFTYTNDHPEVQIFNISSGSVYGLTASQTITFDSLATFAPNDFGPGDYYNMAKLVSEAKHRSWSDLNITDLRVFSFFSQFVDISEKFLMSEVTACIDSGTELETSAADIVRDYCNAGILIEIMSFLYRHGKENTVYDVVSKKPVTKFELLNGLAKDWSLKYRITDDQKASVTGVKNTYCSDGQKLRSLGYEPSMTSYEMIISELSNR